MKRVSQGVPNDTAKFKRIQQSMRQLMQDYSAVEKEILKSLESKRTPREMDTLEELRARIHSLKAETFSAFESLVQASY